YIIALFWHFPDMVYGVSFKNPSRGTPTYTTTIKNQWHQSLKWELNLLIFPVNRPGFAVIRQIYRPVQ
ncbi:MAG: hypothetical protein WCG51_04900, partial [Elusimicrobiota bacterium]